VVINPDQSGQPSGEVHVGLDSIDPQSCAPEAVIEDAGQRVTASELWRSGSCVSSSDHGSQLSLEQRRETKEALNRLLLDKQKELLRLRLQAKEKQLAQLRGRLQDWRTNTPSPVDPLLSQDAPASSSTARVVADPPGSSMQQPPESSTPLFAVEEHKARLKAAVERWRRDQKEQVRGPMAASATVRSHSPCRPAAGSDRVLVIDSDAESSPHEHQGASCMAAYAAQQRQPARIVRAQLKPSARSAYKKATLRCSRSRSRSLSLGGASDDSEVQRRWRAQEALWQHDAALLRQSGNVTLVRKSS